MNQVKNTFRTLVNTGALLLTITSLSTRCSGGDTNKKNKKDKKEQQEKDINHNPNLSTDLNEIGNHLGVDIKAAKDDTQAHRILENKIRQLNSVDNLLAFKKKVQEAKNSKSKTTVLRSLKLHQDYMKEELVKGFTKVSQDKIFSKKDKSLKDMVAALRKYLTEKHRPVNFQKHKKILDDIAAYLYDYAKLPLDTPAEKSIPEVLKTMLAVMGINNIIEDSRTKEPHKVFTGRSPQVKYISSTAELLNGIQSNPKTLKKDKTFLQGLKQRLESNNQDYFKLPKDLENISQSLTLVKQYLEAN